jgi:hypothetical protein
MVGIGNRLYSLHIILHIIYIIQGDNFLPLLALNLSIKLLFKNARKSLGLAKNTMLSVLWIWICWKIMPYLNCSKLKRSDRTKNKKCFCHSADILLKTWCNNDLKKKKKNVKKRLSKVIYIFFLNNLMLKFSAKSGIKLSVQQTCVPDVYL